MTITLHSHFCNIGCHLATSYTSMAMEVFKTFFQTQSSVIQDSYEEAKGAVPAFPVGMNESAKQIFEDVVNVNILVHIL